MRKSSLVDVLEPGEYCNRFGEEGGDATNGELGSSEKRFFSHAPRAWTCDGGE
ncbi:hypothetical protein [Caulifigura coniformis]|nr:hypothetical protein [Caulifigura coniformis]